MIFINDNISRLTFTIDKEAHDVVKLLSEAGVKIAVAESCTGGLLAAAITSVGGASSVFGFGFVTYANEAKEKLLCVPHDILEKHGAISRQTAEYMAIGAMKAAGSDCAVSVTGSAGPLPGEGKPAGTVFIGFCNGTGIESIPIFIDTDGIEPDLKREYIRKKTVLAALQLLKGRI